MNGYQITFFTELGRRHHHQPLSEWLLLAARDLGLRGGTILPAKEGFGSHHRVHSAHFFWLADQPQEILFMVTAEEKERLFEFLRIEGIRLFYVMSVVELGVLGDLGS